MADRTTILNLNRQAGDAHIGQTLVRLARLAEAAHQMAAVEGRVEPWRGFYGVEGLDPRPVVHSSRRASGRGASQVHREVDQ